MTPLLDMLHPIFVSPASYMNETVYIKSEDICENTS